MKPAPIAVVESVAGPRHFTGVDAALVGRILEHGVVVAGGLHPAIRDRYFRVGHMGYAASQPEMLRRTVVAVCAALAERGVALDPEAAVAAAGAVLSGNPAS